MPSRIFHPASAVVVSQEDLATYLLVRQAFLRVRQASLDLPLSFMVPCSRQDGEGHCLGHEAIPIDEAHGDAHTPVPPQPAAWLAHLAYHRQAMGWTQRDLGQRLSPLVDSRTVYQWEAKGLVPSLAYQSQLAILLGLDFPPIKTSAEDFSL